MFQSMIVGLGQIGLMYDFDAKRLGPSSHTSAYLNNNEIILAAASELNSQRSSILKEIAPDTIFYEEYKQMLCEQSADIISICTPPQSHLEIIDNIVRDTSTSIIFCEKPVVQNIEEAYKLIDLLGETRCLVIPNLSRRWSSGIQRVQKAISSHELGALQKVSVRYTRGIFNTGSHIFDLINWFAGEINKVWVVNQVSTSADQESDPSFSFHFTTDQQITGYAEAFDDRNYYMFEIDLFFDAGKIEILESGNKINYLHVESHPLFSGFTSLHLGKRENNLLQESTLQNAVNHLVNVLKKLEEPICCVRDGLLPIFIAQAILRSNDSHRWEPVSVDL